MLKNIIKMPVPKNKLLYAKVKRMANKKFDTPSSIYRSSWIVKKYKSLGGRYTSKKKPKKTGLARWFKEEWVDLKRPIKTKAEKSTKKSTKKPTKKSEKVQKYMPCGRPSAKMTKLKYPLCRPSIRVTKKTPRTYKEISKKSLVKAKKQKKSMKRIKFGK